MDSKPRRLLPFGGSSSSTLSSPSTLSSSSSLGAGSLYGRGSVLSSERFGRSSSSKLDSDYQSSRFLSSSRDYSSPESRHSSWKLSSPLSSSVSCDRSWADSSLGSSRSKLVRPTTPPKWSTRPSYLKTDTERRLGSYTGLLSSTQDSESKRAKLSYTNRATYGRTPGSSTTSSTYSSLNSAADMPWKSLSPLSRSSSSSSTSSSSSSSSEGLWARRELDKRGTTGLSGLSSLGERSSTYSSSLYRPERLTSTYAQGARPKESLSSSTRRELNSSRHLLSSPTSSTSSSSSDYLSPSPARASLSSTSDRLASSSITASSSRARSSLADPSRLSSWSSTPYTPLSQRRSSPPPSSPAPAPSEPASSQPDGRRSTRHLLSRLFSRRSSQDSASTPAPPPPPAPRLPVPTPEPPVVAAAPRPRQPEQQEEAAVVPDPVQSAFAMLRRRRQELSPVREPRSRAPVGQQQTSPEFWRSQVAAAAVTASGRGGGGGAAATAATTTAAAAGSGGGGGGGSSWLSSSLRNRCTPLFSRRRREGRDETAARTEPPHVSPDAPRSQLEEEDEDDDDEDDDDEEDESEGAAGSSSTGPLGLSAAQLQDAARLAGLGHGHTFSRMLSNPLLRMPEHMMLGVGGTGGRGQPDGQEKEKEKPVSSRDPERLRKLQESLLLEDSDEEEGDRCRICQMGEDSSSSSNPLIEPCRCTGSLQYVHQDCIKKWLLSKISSGTNLDAITTCELCKEKLHLNIDNFDINELYRSHERSEYEFISCGLYLVVLLHLCEQRFSDVLGAANEAGFFNLARTLHEHMDNLESSYTESDEEEVRDTRPSIDFCDLDDDDDDEEEEEY